MKFLFAIAVFFLLNSCKEEASVSYPEPDNLIEKQQMVEVLTELTIVEAAYQMKYIQVSRYSSLLQQEADSIFRVFNTDRVAFDESMTYYGQHQQELLEIYQQVKVNVENRKKELPPVSNEIPAQPREESIGNQMRQKNLDSIARLQPVKTEEDL